MLSARAALRERHARTARRAPDDVHHGVGRGAARALVLRYREAAADLLWVRALLYFGAAQEQRREPRWITEHLEDVLALDPDFRRAYRFAAVLARFRRGGERELAETGIRFLERGAARFPHDWEFPFYIGATYLSEMPARDEAERARLRRIGADYIQRAALLGEGKAPDWLSSLAATVLTELGEKEVAVRHLEEVLASAPDDATRERVRGKLIALRGRVEAERMASAVEAFVARWRRDYPYLSGDLYVLLGERIAGRLPDWRALAGGRLPDVPPGDADPAAAP